MIKLSCRKGPNILTIKVIDDIITNITRIQNYLYIKEESSDTDVTSLYTDATLTLFISIVSRETVSHPFFFFR